jgi:8-oxo-dGTP pyrophosphatase MutT (NUDIX family)
MGQQGPNKKMPGTRIGFGGKCDPKPDGTFESTLECAVREMKEEAGLEFPVEKYKKCGNFKVSDKSIDCFVVEVDEKFKPPSDNKEFVDVKWISGKDLPKLKDILPGDKRLMRDVKRYIETGKTFAFRKRDTKELKERTKNIYK